MFIGSFSDVSVTANASAGSLSQSAGTVSFSNDATLAVAGSADAGGDIADAQNGSVFFYGKRSAAALYVGGGWRKARRTRTLYVRNDERPMQSPDLVLSRGVNPHRGAAM